MSHSSVERNPNTGCVQWEGNIRPATGALLSVRSITKVLNQTIWLVSKVTWIFLSKTLEE